MHLGVVATDAKEIRTLLHNLSSASSPIELDVALQHIRNRDVVAAINHPRLPDTPDWKIRRDAILYVNDEDKKATHPAICAIEVMSGTTQDPEGEHAQLADQCEWTTLGGSDIHVGKKGWKKHSTERAATIITFSINEKISPLDVLFRIREDGHAKNNGLERRVLPVSSVSEKVNLLASLSEPNLI